MLQPSLRRQAGNLGGVLLIALSLVALAGCGQAGPSGNNGTTPAPVTSCPLARLAAANGVMDAQAHHVSVSDGIGGKNIFSALGPDREKSEDGPIIVIRIGTDEWTKISDSNWAHGTGTSIAGLDAGRLSKDMISSVTKEGQLGSQNICLYTTDDGMTIISIDSWGRPSLINYGTGSVTIDYNMVPSIEAPG